MTNGTAKLGAVYSSNPRYVRLMETAARVSARLAEVEEDLKTREGTSEFKKANYLFSEGYQFRREIVQGKLNFVIWLGDKEEARVDRSPHLYGAEARRLVCVLPMVPVEFDEISSQTILRHLDNISVEKGFAMDLNDPYWWS